MWHPSEGTESIQLGPTFIDYESIWCDYGTLTPFALSYLQFLFIQPLLNGVPLCGWYITMNCKNGLTDTKVPLGTDSLSVGTGPRRMLSFISKERHVALPRIRNRVNFTYQRSKAPNNAIDFSIKLSRYLMHDFNMKHHQKDAIMQCSFITYLGMKSWDSHVCDRASTIKNVDRVKKSNPWYNKIWLCLNVTIWSSQICFSVIFIHIVIILKKYLGKNCTYSHFSH